MCGILGTIDLPFTESALERMKHRGPDDYGLRSLSVAGHQITLGHRRLSIVDISQAGHQPMETEDGRYMIVFNGEVYNHMELRRQLRQKSFRGHSDTESILYALAENGIKALESFNGIFGFCFVDRVAAKIYIARDPFGVKPVYYKLSGNQLCFASEIRPIRMLADSTVSRDRLATLLRLRYLPSPDTIYDDISKIRPGHYLEVSLSGENVGIREIPYIPTIPAEKRISLPDALEQYDHYFSAAVERQLMSDVEIGILLSGGVDSALVAASARSKCSQKIKAFTIGFEENAGEDEINDAAQTAGFLGLDHHVVRISSQDFFTTLQECVRITEEPLATTSLIPMHFLARLAASQVKVVLTGQGADEPLGGYRRYQGELLTRYIPTSLGPLANAVIKGAKIKSSALLRGANVMTEPDTVRRFLKTYEVFSPEEIYRLTGIRESIAENRIRYFHDLLGCSQKKNSVEQMMAVDVRMNLADDLLLYTDKITMNHSLECRVPLLDLELVRFIESLPSQYRVRLKKGKIIHKKYAEKKLPPDIVHRPKKGFLSPTRKWFRQSDTLRGILLDPNSTFAAFFDQNEVKKIIERHDAGYNMERHLFLLLCVRFVLDNDRIKC